jgi:hypothetical protein
MTRKGWLIALGVIATASPVLASQPDPSRMKVAPAGTPQTRYCMRIEAVTGTRLETVKCWTREEWAEQGVDVDTDWPKEGVAVIG